VVLTKRSVYWNITPCSSLKVSQRFGKYAASFIMVEKQAKQQTGMKQAASSTYYSFTV
jgi:hypothetical protein